MNQGNNSMQRTTHTLIALLALFALSGLGSTACQAGTSAITEHSTEPHTAKPACTLTHDGSLPGHFILLRLCQLEQQRAAAATPPTATASPVATVELHQADPE